jgi:hypothetical protein
MHCLDPHQEFLIIPDWVYYDFQDIDSYLKIKHNVIHFIRIPIEL